MARGGFRPGAGRPKGARSKRKEDRSPKDTKGERRPKRKAPVMAAKKPVTEAPAPESREAKAPNQFSSSIEFAMSVINDPNADTADKIRLAIALMPFQAPKLAEKKADDGKGGKRSVSSKFAPPPPPGSKPQLAVSND